MAKKQPSKGAGRKAESGNVIVDLGEDIDKKIRSAVGDARRSMERTEMGRPGEFRSGGFRPGVFGHRPGGYRPGGYRPGGYRPGMFGGYRPWYADRTGRGGSMGMAFMTEPVKPVQMLGGLALGVVGNRALVRVTPDLIGHPSEVIHTGIAFVVGLVPVLVRPNSITVGVAIPGAVYFAGALVDFAMNKVGIKKPTLSGAEAPAQAQPQALRGGADAALAARQKLAHLQSQIQQPVQQQQYAGNPRAVAYAQ